MTFLRLTFRSALFYWRAHALVLAGTLLSAAILVGALLVGDSVKFSLTQSALLRLGIIQYAMESRGRFFAADLATRLETETRLKISPALLFRGIALRSTSPGSEPLQVNNIQILGVQDSFWSFASNTNPAPILSGEGILINQKLADALHVQTGDAISIRFSKPALMSRDAPLSTQEKNDTVRATLTVEAIVPDPQLGRFNLSANQQIPLTAFVNLSRLQQTAGVPFQANLLLAAGDSSGAGEMQLNQAIRKVWRLEDAGLNLKTIDGGRLFQLECDRVFMDPPISSALSNLPKSVGTLTYLVNSIARTHGSPLKETPYSFVVAHSPSDNATLGMVPPDMKDDEIIINRWLADQLTALPGDGVKLTYFELSALNTFVEQSRTFTIRRIAEMSELAGERDLSPDFPGLTDAGKCSEWDIGMPLDKKKIEDAANEAYWNEYRDTPKAIVTLKAGQAMWANRFGNLTALRFRASEDGAAAITEVLLQHLNPNELGLTFAPIRESALKAAAEAMNLGHLFLGMSFFLIVASLMLTGLLFAFGIQQRSEETGLLLAMGFRSMQIRRLWIQECVLVAGVGSFAGALLGTYYTKVMIWGLSHVWQGAVAHAEIQYHATPGTMIVGAFLSFVFAMGALLLALKHQTTKTTRELLGGASTAAPLLDGMTGGIRGGIFFLATPRAWAPVAVLISAFVLVTYAALTAPPSPAPIFFAAGSLLLISLLGFARLLLSGLARPGRRLTPRILGMRNAGRNPARSLTVIGLMASGCFLILAVASMQEDIERNASHRDSGTGGFALFAETSLPLQADPNSKEGREAFDLDQNPDLNEVQIVPMKIRSGDDASCLNLNRAQSPTLIGVDPEVFAYRGAFQNPKEKVSIWTLLNRSCTNGIIPGLVGDANTAQWGLKRKTGVNDGDIIEFRDERGDPFRVRLVGSLPMRLSVFQGAILIPAQSFASCYPSESGTRMFLIDAKPGTELRVREALTAKLGKWGVNVTPAVERLKSFYAVETTYMAMFLVLGGMGMLLGSAGMAIVILRNIQERRNELALLTATGYSPEQIRTVVLAEHGLILGVGLAIGGVAALVAIWPGLQAPGVNLPWALMTGLITGLLLLQVCWILLSARFALRGPLIKALRDQ